MSRILHYDCFAGISGDMNLAALLDLGVPLEYLKAQLSRLSIGEYDLTVEKADQNGIFGTRVTVTEPGHAHEHSHGHGHAAHHHRSFSEIRKMIESSSLNDKVKKSAIDIFALLAEAEGQVHGKPAEEVHFHEVGAIDSLVDIVGGVICLDYLNVDIVTCSKVELGGGLVKCAHGVMPVPAPATAILASYFPTGVGGTDHEATTPTGAAYIAAVVDEFEPSFSGRCLKTGVGLGHRYSDKVPNIMRVLLYETDAAGEGDGGVSQHAVLAANIDDMTPEHLSFLTEMLFEKGADDVWMEPVYMKKGRLATKVSALVGVEARESVISAFFQHSSSLGLRETPVIKHMLSREVYERDTRYGRVRVKKAFLPDGSEREKWEFDDCRRLAREHDVPVRNICDDNDQQV